jgi:hypothetical protein
MTDQFEPELSKGCLAIIDPDRKPIEDNIVLLTLNLPAPHACLVLLPYAKRGGKDNGGRFCKPGDPREIVASFSGIACMQQDLNNRTIEILGTVWGSCVRPHDRDLRHGRRSRVAYRDLRRKPRGMANQIC